MQYILPKSRHEETQDTPDNTDAESLSVDDKQFCELFSFPLSESPLPGKAVLGTVLPPSVKKSTTRLSLCQSIHCQVRLSQKLFFLPVSEDPLPVKAVLQTVLPASVAKSSDR